MYWCLFIGIIFLSNWLLIHLFPARWSRLVYGILATLSAFLTTWLFLKYEKRSFSDIGLIWRRGTLLRFFIGVVIGVLIFFSIMILLLGFAKLELHRNPKSISLTLLTSYFVFVPLALMEEIAFRSYAFLKLYKAFGLRWTQIIVAVAFALYHILNGWDPLIAFLGPGIWAFVYGLAAISSGGISLSTGLHVALNMMQLMVGIKGTESSFWLVKYKEGVNVMEMKQVETIGIVIQLLVLMFAIILTEWYVRKMAILGSGNSAPEKS